MLRGKLSYGGPWKIPPQLKRAATLRSEMFVTIFSNGSTWYLGYFFFI